MNDHQRFTGINLPDGEVGAWKSLCGTESKDICRIYEEVVGAYPSDDLIGEAKWVLGGSVFYGGAVKCRSLDEYRAWLTEKHELDPLPPAGNGLRHDCRTMTAALLYPASPQWLFSERALSLTNWDIEEYLDTPEAMAVDGIPITLNVGYKDSVHTLRYDSRVNVDHTKYVLKKLIDADKAPIAFVSNPEFFWQQLNKQTAPYFDLCEFVGKEFGALVSCFVMMWEVGKAFNGDHLEDRWTAVKRLRRGTERAERGDVRIFQHERSLEGIPRSDFKKVDQRYTGSALQTGFDTSLPDCVSFVKDNVDRWRRYEPQHTVLVAETSIPSIYVGQPWTPSRTFSEATAWSKAIVNGSKCSTDWSGGYRP